VQLCTRVLRCETRLGEQISIYTGRPNVIKENAYNIVVGYAFMEIALTFYILVEKATRMEPIQVISYIILQYIRSYYYTHILSES